MSRIFVSYTMRDGFTTVDKLRLIDFRLRKIGAKPFVDILHNDRACPQSHVENMLTASSLVVAIRSPSFLTSEWVQFELELARQRRIPIVEIPVLSLMTPTA